MVFTGFEPSAGELPDASTICRFRNRLVAAGLDQKLLTLVNGQLEHPGLKVQGARGAIIDATIIPSAARPNRHLEEGEPPRVVDSPDAEARWVKKGKDAFFGYRGHTAVDSEDGYVEHVHVRPANEAEITQLPQIVEALEPGAIRFKVEQAFGTMKRRFNLARARYFGVAKVQAQMCWAALGMNLLKAHRKLKAMELAAAGAVLNGPMGPQGACAPEREKKKKKRVPVSVHYPGGGANRPGYATVFPCASLNASSQTPEYLAL